MQPLLVTAALPYANGPIHLGHLLEYIQADIWVRYWRLRGRDTLYVCADDTHGTPVMLKARQDGVSPEDLVAQVGLEHQRDFAGFEIEFDQYHSTHSAENQAAAEEIFLKLVEGGHIVRKPVWQARCGKCDLFLPDRYVRGMCPRCHAPNQYGDSCEKCASVYTPEDLVEPRCGECGSVPEWTSSTHLFLRVSDFAAPLREWLEGRVAKDVRHSLDKWFEDGLRDWCISRGGPYFGFPIPGEVNKYFYVWLDAPIGYIASTAAWASRTGADFDAYWRSQDTELCQFIGKDILYFHALFWPAMLMGSGFRTPSRLFVHGFLTVNGQKMSKSRGTFVTAERYLASLDPQYLRYYYAAKLGPKVDDIDLHLDDFRNRVNADLVNRIANIPSRTLSIVARSCQGRLGKMDEDGRELFRRCRGQCDEIAQHYREMELGRAIEAINRMASDINVHLTRREPWELASVAPPRAADVCTGVLNSFKIVATLLSPVVPTFASTFAAMLGIDELTWEALDDLVEEQVVEPYVHLVRRMDIAALSSVFASPTEQ